MRGIKSQSHRLWWAGTALIILILLNFSFLFFKPDKEVQTIVGPIGASGLKGDKGDRGDVGPEGEKGDTGLTGSPGIQGATGLQGPQGVQGETGPQGVQGQDGATGAQGLQGETGIQGIPGNDGREIELRGNNENQSIEWRYAGETDWRFLVKYCSLANNCPAEPQG